MQEKTELKLRKKLKNCTMTLTGKQQKHQLYHLEEILPPDQRRVVKQGKFAYSPLGKAFKETNNI